MCNLPPLVSNADLSHIFLILRCTFSTIQSQPSLGSVKEINVSVFSIACTYNVSV